MWKKVFQNLGSGVFEINRSPKPELQRLTYKYDPDFTKKNVFSVILPFQWGNTELAIC